MSAGFFVDWNGDLRSTEEPGGGYHCDVDLPARYVAVLSKNGALIHEATLYKTEADLEKAGIKAKLVPGSHPWAAAKDGF
ncbi:hypothetical protein QM467_01370 [Rhodoblastus sp. 17X3]|uniref:hypothetical protein n=1 Tax=Rhodoblastus sp. 17X3 TaxID=3047026 RepID=UPI0024B8440F|nr:hypothetical protein [Rhodoblastus sp. 17X3]MDI9846704.1 hypothetical protein [Rhodoblastus sp. 17X3]